MGLPKTVVFENLTPVVEKQLDAYLAAHGFRRSVGNTGIIEGNSVRIRFEIDAASEKLTLTYEIFPPEITTGHATKFIKSMITKGAAPLAAQGDTNGVYNYFRFYLHNETGLPMHPKDKISSYGSITPLVTEVPSMNRPVKDPIYGRDAYIQTYECQADVDSAFGVEGAIVMGIGNGAAQVTFNYQLRGSDWFRCDVTIEGNESSRWDVEKIDYWNHLHGEAMPSPPVVPSAHVDCYTYCTALIRVVPKKSD